MTEDDEATRWMKRLMWVVPKVSYMVPPLIVAAVIIWCGMKIYESLSHMFDYDLEKRKQEMTDIEGDRADHPLNPNNVHLPCSYYAHRGPREYMEDRYAFQGRIGGKKDMSYYGCFDGHGGALAAQYAADQLHVQLASFIGQKVPLEEALIKSYLNVDEEFCRAVEGTGRMDGTTAVVALIDGSRLYVANAGDSRALLVQRGARAVPLSQDHKPCEPNEQKRITDAGGKIVFWGRWRVEGVLAVSRAIGDSHLKRYVPADPELRMWDLTDNDHFLVLATDGLWDVLSNETVANIVMNHSHEFKAVAQHLCQEAWVNGTTDNVTALVIDLRQRVACPSNDLSSSSASAADVSVSGASGSAVDVSGKGGSRQARQAQACSNGKPQADGHGL